MQQIDIPAGSVVTIQVPGGWQNSFKVNAVSSLFIKAKEQSNHGGKQKKRIAKKRTNTGNKPKHKVSVPEIVGIGFFVLMVLYAISA